MVLRVSYILIMSGIQRRTSGIQRQLEQFYFYPFSSTTWIGQCIDYTHPMYAAGTRVQKFYHTPHSETI